MKVINNFSGLEQGKLTLVFRSTVTEEQAKQHIESHGCTMDSFINIIAKVTCPPGKEAHAQMNLTVPGFCQANRVVKRQTK